MVKIAPYKLQLLPEEWRISLPNQKGPLCYSLKENYIWFDRNGRASQPITLSRSGLTIKSFENETHQVQITSYKNGFLAVNITPKEKMYSGT